MNTTQLTVLLAGFDPYEDVEVNPALVVPDEIAQHGVSVDENDLDDPLHDVTVNIRAVHMPVSYTNSWSILQDAIEREQPDIVIAMGLKRAARGILLERGAVNVKDAERPDADNVIARGEPIFANGPAAFWTRLPLRAILDDFTDDQIPASLSSDAGTFVCNTLFYHLLYWASEHGTTIVGFVNLPVINEQPHSQHGLPLQQQVRAVSDVIREAARYYLMPSFSEILIDQPDSAEEALEDIADDQTTAHSW